jgi:hypothetical protein
MRSGRLTRAAHLVTWRYGGSGSKAVGVSSRPWSSPPGRSSRGTESAKAWATAPKAFSIPGPACTVTTAGRRPFVARAYPSAMLSSVFSVRAMMGRMPRAAAASINGLAG